MSGNITGQKLLEDKACSVTLYFNMTISEKDLSEFCVIIPFVKKGTDTPISI